MWTHNFWRLAPPPQYLLWIQCHRRILISASRGDANAVRPFERINFKASGGQDAFCTSFWRDGIRFKPISAYWACLKGCPQTSQTKHSHTKHGERRAGTLQSRQPHGSCAIQPASCILPIAPRKLRLMHGAAGRWNLEGVKYHSLSEGIYDFARSRCKENR